VSIKDTIAGARNNAKQHMSETKIDRTAKENNELRAENRVLRDELAEDRSERAQVLDLLGKAQFSMSGPSKRRVKVLRLIAVGGAVYAVATKTGARERIKDWVNTMRGTTEQFGADLASKGSEMMQPVGDTIEHAGRKLERAGESIKQSAPQAASDVPSATKLPAKGRTDD
jgi:hypothetical protein